MALVLNYCQTTATSEQQPPVNNDHQPESPAPHEPIINSPSILDQPLNNGTFSGSRGWPLYTGLMYWYFHN